MLWGTVGFFFLCEGIAVDRHLLVRCLCHLFIVVAARKSVFLVFNTRAERLTLRRIGVFNLFNIDAASKKIEAAMIADVDLNKMAQPTRCETKVPNLSPRRIASRRLLSHKSAVGDLVEASLRLLVDVGGEADAAALRSRRVHQFADGRENGGDRLVMVLKLAFEFVELAGQGGVRGQ